MESTYRTLILFCLFCICFGNIFGETPVQIPDSLLQGEGNDSLYLEKLLQFSKENSRLEPELVLEVNHHLIAFSDSIGNLSMKAKGHYAMARTYTDILDSRTALVWLDSLENTALVVPDSQLYYNGLVLKGVNLDNIGHFRRSLGAFRKAEVYFRRQEDRLKLAMISNNIAGIYFQQEKFEQAKDYYLESGQAGKELGHQRLYFAASINLGHVYLSMDSLESAEAVLKQLYAENYKNQTWVNHGPLCLMLGDLRLKQKRYVESEAFFKEGMEIGRADRDWWTLSKGYSGYGELYQAKGDLEAALVAFDSSRAISVRIQTPDHEIYALEFMWKLQDTLGMPLEAFRSYKSYIAIRDSLFGNEKQIQLEELSAIHDAEQRQLEIDRLESERSLQDKLLYQQYWFIGGLGLILLIAVVLLVLVYRSERRRRAVNLSLHDRNEKIAEQQSRILAQNSLLEKQNKHLEMLNSEMEGLIEIVAHDLKSPISKTQALIGMVEQKLPPAEAGPEIPMINRVLQSGMDLIRDILTIGRIENEARHLDKEDLNLVAVLEELAGSFAARAQEKKIDLELKLTDGPETVHSVRGSIDRIMENILSNALKFSPTGTKVELVLEPNAEDVRIAVQDQGPGISKTDQKVMFRKFQRLSARPTGGESSTGLGLSIVHVLAQQLGGSIEVESELGKGTRFTLVLPRK